MADAAFDPDMVARLVPAKRAGSPQDVAALAAFLASDEAGYITGQVISVSGGPSATTSSLPERIR